MMRLRHSELRRFSTVVQALSADSEPEVPSSEHLLQAIARLVPLDRVSYNEVDRATGQIILAHSMGEPPAPNLVSSLNTHIREHPGFSQPDAASDWPAPTKISDFLSQRQFRQLGLYHDHFRLYGIHYQHGIAFAAGTTRKISFGLNRASRDFPEESRTLLTLLRPHLVRAYERSRVHTELTTALRLRDQALKAVAVIVLTARGAVEYWSPSARAMLARFFPSPAGDDIEGTRLPAPLARWVARQGGSLIPPSPSRAELVLRQGTRKLLVRLEVGDEYQLLRLADHPSSPSAEGLRGLGLTGREAEVLLWLAQGKRDVEIALICGLHPMTVSTHVRNLLAKLGCETRTAAAALAWERFGEAFD